MMKLVGLLGLALLTAPVAVAQQVGDTDLLGKGQRLYKNHCALCHGDSGEGAPPTFPALSGNDPVVFYESQRLYNQTEIFHAGGVPAEYYRVPIGEPVVLKEGSDLTILTIGATLYTATKAAQRFQDEFGIYVWDTTSAGLIEDCIIRNNSCNSIRS